jgi:D-aminoacyl-tRNA deacylase
MMTGSAGKVTFVVSRQDMASISIGRKIMEHGGWAAEGNEGGMRLFSGGDFLLLEIGGIHIRQEHLDRTVLDRFGFRPSVMVFLSSHRSESNTPAATVHPVGNYGGAQLGGEERRIVHSPAAFMTGRMIRMKKEFAGTRYEATFEATHHGPYLDTPSVFAEIGSDEAAWQDGTAAEKLASALLCGNDSDGPIAIGLGGGHYCPRFVEIAVKRRISFSHFVPNHSLGLVDNALADEIAEKSDGAACLVLHSSKKFEQELRSAEKLFRERGMEVIDPSELEPRQGN